MDLEEDFYNSISLSPEDDSLKQKYLAKFGSCISSEGQNLLVEKDVAIVEGLDCTKPFEGIEFFFKNNKLCSRSVQFFPSKKVFAVENRHIPVTLSENWKHIETPETLLFYDSTAKFEEMSGINGEILKKNKFGLYLDASGKAVYPEFVYSNGNWEKVLPLRELFDFSIKGDGAFEINLISEKYLSFSQKELLGQLELKAASSELLTENHGVLKIKGTGLKGVKFPKFEYSGDRENDYGIYKISLFSPELQQKAAIVSKSSSYELEIVFSTGKLEANLVIFSKKLASEDAAKIQALINREIPAFFIEKK